LAKLNGLTTQRVLDLSFLRTAEIFFFLEGYRSLKAGQEVTFEVQQGPKGLHAENIGFKEEPER